MKSKLTKPLKPIGWKGEQGGRKGMIVGYAMSVDTEGGPYHRSYVFKPEKGFWADADGSKIFVSNYLVHEDNL